MKITKFHQSLMNFLPKLITLNENVRSNISLQNQAKYLNTWLHSSLVFISGKPFLIPS